MAERKGLEGVLQEVMALKQKTELEAENLLALLSLVNLMGLVDLIGGLEPGSTSKERVRQAEGFFPLPVPPRKGGN